MSTMLTITVQILVDDHTADNFMDGDPPALSVVADKARAKIAAGDFDVEDDEA